MNNRSLIYYRQTRGVVFVICLWLFIFETRQIDRRVFFFYLKEKKKSKFPLPNRVALIAVLRNYRHDLIEDHW